MKRTAEKVLAIIGVIFTAISLIISFIGLAMIKVFTEDEAIRAEIEMDLFSAPEFTTEEVEFILTMIDFLEGFMWGFIILLLISFAVTIIGIIFMWNNKNSKLAGVMFILGGLFAFIFTPTSILLYIAGILCFTRKPPYTDDSQIAGEYPDETMRPL